MLLVLAIPTQKFCLRWMDIGHLMALFLFLGNIGNRGHGIPVLFSTKLIVLAYSLAANCSISFCSWLQIMSLIVSISTRRGRDRGVRNASVMAPVKA